MSFLAYMATHVLESQVPTSNQPIESNALVNDGTLD